MGEVIRRTFGVTYDPSHISRLLHRLGYSVQRPIERATQRDEAAIRVWWEQRWPALKKRPTTRNGDLVWVDQSGFYLLPHHVRTWARARQTPVLARPLHPGSSLGHRRPHGSDERLFLQTQSGAYHSTDVVRFPASPLAQDARASSSSSGMEPPFTVASRSRTSWLAGAAKRIHLEQLPGYAPDLNPVEGIWAYLKCRELGNVCCQDFPELDTRAAARQRAAASQASRPPGLHHGVRVSCLALYTDIRDSRGGQAARATGRHGAPAAGQRPLERGPPAWRVASRAPTRLAPVRPSRPQVAAAGSPAPKARARR